MSLRARLLVALLGVGLVPTILVATLAVFQLNLAMAPWFRPGVDRALSSALQITQAALTRFESTVLAQSADWAERWPSIDPETKRRTVALALKTTNLDFVQVYHRNGDAWQLDEQVLPEGILLTDGPSFEADIDSALARDPLIRSNRGALAAVSGMTDGRALVAGILVQPEFFDEAKTVADGVTFYGRSAVYGPLERMSHWFIVALVILLVAGLATVIANAIARETSRPLRELAIATDRVAAGDLTTRVEPRGSSEFKRLGGSFNVMTGRLSEARTALRQAEREAAWRDAARKLAHEFKNMLTPIKLALQRIERNLDDLSEDRRERTARSIGRALGSVEGLERLSSQFHQYARLPEPAFESLDALEIVRGATDGVAGAHVTAATEARVRADRVLLTRALHNLVLNAREASPSDTPVVVEVHAEGEEVIIEVLDRGAGLPPDLRARLFDPYVSTKKRGSGLGLALVRDIIRLHEGTIVLENREGGGARARLTLPRWESSAAPESFERG